MRTVTIKSKMVDGAAIIYPGVYLNQLRGEVIEHQCQELLSQGVRRLVINFEETELINSIGISILLEVMETIRAAHATLLLSNLNDSNRELFQMLGLMAHVRVEETEQSALAKLHAYT